MEQNTPITVTPPSVAVKAPDSNMKWKIITAVMAVIAVCGVGFGIFQVVEASKNSEEIDNLKSEVVSLKEQQAQNTNKTQSGATTIFTESINNANSGSIAAKKYLEPEGWNVRFAYPDGVTDVQYGMNDNYDGALYIYSITKNGKTYDINMCGGRDAYQQYPFFLGLVSRWNPSGSHESWESSPATYDSSKLALTNGGYDYYIDMYYGNGCETGDNNPDYLEALRISKSLLDSVEIK